MAVAVADGGGTRGATCAPAIQRIHPIISIMIYRVRTPRDNTWFGQPCTKTCVSDPLPLRDCPPLQGGQKHFSPLKRGSAAAGGEGVAHNSTCLSETGPRTAECQPP